MSKNGAMDHRVTFGRLNSDGTLSDVRMLKQSDIAKCPFCILAIEHYREDGTCKCNDSDHRKMMIKKWGYKKRDFVKAGVIKKDDNI